MKLRRKVALVTGAGRGIGRGIAEYLCEQGVRTVLASRTWGTVAGVADSLREKRADCLAVRCDVTQRGDIEAAVSQCVEAYGRLDILVNNAQSFGLGDNPTGTPIPKPLETFPADEWDFTLRSGLYATLWAMQAAFPHLRDSGQAAIVNFASENGFSGISGTAAYNAAKEGIRALTRTAAREWGPHGITVNVIMPVVTTDAMKQFFEFGGPGAYGEFEAQVPMRRFGDAKLDAGGLVAFLGGPTARYITGKTFELDGGSLLHA